MRPGLRVIVPLKLGSDSSTTSKLIALFFWVAVLLGALAILIATA